MLCEFEQITERNEKGTADFRCKACARIVYRVLSKSADKIIASCTPKGEPRKPLSLLDMAATAARAATNFVASGGKTVTGEVQTARQTACNTCPSHDSTANRCNECGCFLQLKTWLPDEKCPAGKW